VSQFFGIELVAVVKAERQCTELRANAYEDVARGRKHRRGDHRLLAAAAQDVTQKEQRMDAAYGDHDIVGVDAVEIGDGRPLS
jgi:hypothetical protein